MKMRAFRLRPVAEFLRNCFSSRLGWGALASIPGLAVAGPTGESVVAGGAVVTRPSGTHTQVDQSTKNAVINWSTFSVAGDELVLFNQPGTTSSVLNRVVGSGQSEIFGQIQANGRVFLVNPQGVYFAPGAKVDVGALTASILDIPNADFMAGNYVFTRPDSAPDGATVENAGEINVSDGGFVVLAGDYTKNSGVISARLGNVVLAAGNRMTMELSDDGLMSFAVDEATVASLAGADNTGEIFADGGRIIMTAKVANDLVATAVNNDGLLQAHRIVEEGGEIFLSASGADISHTGTIDVAGESGQSGGEVAILGNEDIVLATGSKIDASGNGSGNGGVVNVIANGKLAFREDADIDVTAGASGERGGSVELSGHEGLHTRGNLNIGAGGDLLLDPAVLTLDTGAASYGSTIGVDFVETQLNASVDVTLSASSSIVKTAGVTDITATTGSGDLRFLISDTTGNINLPGLAINIGGDFEATAGGATGDVTLGSITARNVNIHASGTDGDITLTTGGITAASSSVRLFAGDDIAVAGDITLFSSSGPADIRISAGGDVTISGDISAAGFFGASVSISGNNITAGDINVLAASGHADIDLDAVNDVIVGALSAEVSPSSGGSSYGGGFGDASVDVRAGRNITVDDVFAFTSNSSAFVDLDAVNNLRVNGNVLAVGRDETSISLSGDNTVTVNGNVTGVNLSDSYVDIEIFGDKGVTINGSVRAFATVSSASVDISIGASSGGNVEVTGDIVAIAVLDRADVWVSADGNIRVGGEIRMSASTDASFFAFANGNVTLNGGADIDGAFASLRVIAEGNVNVAGGVNINGDSFAGASYSYDGNGVFGAHNVVTGPGGFAGFFAGSFEGMVPETATFNGRIKAETIGGSSGNIFVDVNQSIRSNAGGVLEADAVFLQTRNTGTTVIDVVTQSPFTAIQNIALTPDVFVDNRAFAGPSTISFGGGSGATVHAARFLATGPLSFNGSLIADNLAVGVTAGSVTFNSPVFITGNQPFLPTAPDIALFNIMGQHGLAPPGHGPNVQIFAQTGINMTNPFVVGGPSAFTKMFSNGPFNISGLTTTAPSMLSVFSPIDTSRAFFFEDEPFAQPSGASAFFNFPTINGLPNNSQTTVVIGEMGPGGIPVLNGDVTIGSQGSIDIGERNMFIISRGSVSGDDLVTTNGIFEIIGIAASEFFQVPIVNEFNDDGETEEEEDDDSLVLNDDGEEDEGGGVSEETNSESMECPA